MRDAAAFNDATRGLLRPGSAFLAWDQNRGRALLPQFTPRPAEPLPVAVASITRQQALCEDLAEVTDTWGHAETTAAAVEAWLETSAR